MRALLILVAILILHVAEHPETKGQSQRLVSVLKNVGVPAKVYPAEGKTIGLGMDEMDLKELAQWLGSHRK